MKIDDCCCNLKREKIVQEKENGKVFSIKNDSGSYVKVCRVDDCLIKGESIRCDFLFMIGDKKSVDEKLFLVEMKGTDHVHALRQIVSAGEILNVRSFSGEKKSAIVGSSSPKITSKYQTELLKLSKKFKHMGLSFPIRKNMKIEVKI